MRRYFVFFVFMGLTIQSFCQAAGGFSSCMLGRDTVMQSSGIEMAFKGGTAVLLDARGLVVEGTPAHSVDLWTPGPLLLFSGAGPVRLDSCGRARSGILGANSLIQCADGEFREFARGFRIGLDSCGLLVRGNPVYGISFSVDGQDYVSQPMMPVSFYPDGRVHIVHPQGNIRVSAPNGGRIVFSPQAWIELSEGGKILRGKLLRKYMGHRPGDVIRLDEDGNVL